MKNILKYAEMIYEKGETFLWYFPDGSPSSLETSTSPDATPTDGWGASAMLYAFMEGLVGIVDTCYQFKKIKLAPRWVIAGVKNARVEESGYIDAKFNVKGRSDIIVEYQ